MTPNKDIVELRQQLRRLQSQLTRMDRPHRVQSKSISILKRNPAHIKAADLDDGSINYFKDDTNDVHGIVIRIEGRAFKFIGTEIGT
jgi:hypothetical protein